MLVDTRSRSRTGVSMGWEPMWKAFREAIKKLPGMKPALGIVILALAAAISSLVLGSAKAAIFGYIFAAIGFVLVVVLLTVGKPVVRGQLPTAAQSEAIRLIKVVSRTFCVLVFLLLLVIIIGWPCPLAIVLGLPNICDEPCRLMPWTCKDKVGVHIQREVNYIGSGCENGERVLLEKVSDRLTFEGKPGEYVIQAVKEAAKETNLKVEYKLAGMATFAPVEWQPHTSDTRKWRYPIPVKGQPVDVVYSWTQRPKPEDHTFTAVAVASSLDILSLNATIILPPNTKIAGPSRLPEHQDDLNLMRSRGCFLRMSTVKGQPDKFDCKGALGNVLNEGMRYPVTWNVFAACEPKP